MKTPILGSAYVARSVNAADSRMVNLFPEIVAEGGKEPAFLSRAPGLNLLATIGNGPIQGLYKLGSYLYVVSGGKFYRVDSSWNSTELGDIATTNPVSISDNGTQIFIAAGGSGYIYNTSTLVFQKITDGDFFGAVNVGYLDGYFVYNQPGTQTIWVTELLDGTSVDPLDFASAEGSPDKVVGLIVDHREVWIFGTNSVEVWYDSGNIDFPLQRIQGAFNEVGCIAPYSIAKMDNGIFWLGADARGQGIVYRANGYSAIRISTHAIEWQIQQYASISDAVGFTYQQDGHSFYVLTFPSGNTAWVYDVSTQAWHERARWDNGAFKRYRPQCHAFFNNMNIVGDYENGKIYQLDLNTYSDNGAEQRWLRSWRALPTGANNLKRTAQHSLQLDCQTGVGINATTSSTVNITAYNKTTDTLTVTNTFVPNDLVQYQVSSAALSITATVAATNVLTITNTFSVDDAVVYSANTTPAETITASDSATNILSVINSYVANDKIVYTETTPIGGLVSGYTYYVDPVSGTEIRLLDAPSGSVVDITGSTGTGTLTLQIGGLTDGQTYYVLTATGANCTLSDTLGGSVVDITGSTTTGTLQPVIGGLTDGNVYYVTEATSTTVKLSTTSGGTAVNLTGASGTGTLAKITISDPQVMLRWSDDGGHTWSNEHWKSMGAIGEYGYRTYWRRLGMTEKLRDRVYEISGSDPVNIKIMGAELDVAQTNA